MFDIWSSTLCKLLLAIILNNVVDNVLSNECMVNFHKFIKENLLHYCLVHAGWSTELLRVFFFFNTISFFLHLHPKRKKKRQQTITQPTYINILFVLFSVIVFLDSDDGDRQIKLKLTF